MERISLEEAVRLGAVDDAFFGRFFFPRAFKQNSPAFHKQIDEALNSPHYRYVSIMLFRGAGKTTKLRTFTAKRIAYGISRTILYVGKSQDAASKSVQWLKNAIDYNKKFAGTYGLRRGSKWTETEIEIVSEKFKDENGGPLLIRVLAYGMTGSIRGVNIEDSRPDLIVVDDPDDEETTATAEQRKKQSDLFFGSLEKTLAPASENPHAKMALLQTVLNENDLVSRCERSPAWHSLRISCFTEEGESVWPERWTTADFLASKQTHIEMDNLPLWMREMECKVISDEMAAFKMAHLGYWDYMPEGGYTFIAVDPTPPPKDKDANRASAKLDDAVVGVLKAVAGKVLLCDYYTCKSPDPGELINQIFLMAAEWKTKVICVETVLFARVLKWALEQEMQRRRDWLTIIPVEDPRKKVVRIRQEISARVTHGVLQVHRTHTKFIEQYQQYPFVNHDDVIDMVAIGLMHIKPWMLTEDFIEGEFTREIDTPLLEDWRSAP